jgi:hypothetical protein
MCERYLTLGRKTIQNSETPGNARCRPISVPRFPDLESGSELTYRGELGLVAMGDRDKEMENA